jgi:predicted  nucleic acid-binding Zn-ribbon protein
LEKLIADCNLGLDKSSNLEQVIAKVKDLTKTPDSSTEITELKQQKTQLETQLAEKQKTITELQTQKPTEEIKSKVIESSKQLGLLSQSFEQKLSKVSSYQELSQLQQEAFKEKLLEKEVSLRRIESNTKQLKVGLVVLIVFLVLGIAGAVSYFVKQKKGVGEKE